MPRARQAWADLPKPVSATCLTARRLLAGPTIFCVHLLEDLHLHGQIGHQVLEPPVLLLQSPEPPRFGHVHSAVLLLPGVERRLAHVVLGAHRLDRAFAVGPA